MKLLEFPIRNAQFMVVVFAMLMALGLYSWMNIPKSEDPLLGIPTFRITAVLPGASPVDLERLVVREVEERLDELDEVDRIESRIRDGVATIVVEFEADQDPEEKHDEVLREMSSLRPELPAQLARFDIDEVTTLDVAIAQLALVSETAPYHELDLLAEQLTDRLSAVPGVRGAERWGAPERRVDVSLDLGRLAQLDLAPGLIVEAINGESADLPAGAVESGRSRFNVRTSGSFESPEQIAGTVLRATEGQLVRVGDVAEVEWGYADSTYRARYNGARAVFVTVTQGQDEVVQEVRDRIWRVLDEFEADLPQNVTLARGFDQARNVSHRLGRLGVDFLLALGLVLLTLLPLGLRAAGIVMVSIPLSLALGITLLSLTGFTVNTLSIVGAVIALGLLVDDSIVVVENITRLLREGHSRREAALQGTRQIGAAVLGATAALVLAFMPLAFLPGGPGVYIRTFPMTVIYIVAASLLVSLTIIPWLASQVLKPSGRDGGSRILRAFERGIHATYAPLLDQALRHRYFTLALAAILVAASAALVPLVGFSLFPKAETPQFYVNITAPEGASIETTERAARFAERVVARRPHVRAIFTSVGHDNPQIYYNVFPRRDDPTVGQLFVVLDHYDPKRTPAQLDSIRSELSTYPGAKIELREFENGPPTDAPIALRIHGPDLDTLRSVAATVERIFEGTPGTQYVNNPVRLDRTDLRVAIDRGKSGLLGIPTVAIDRTVRLGLTGVEAGVLRESSGEERPVVVQMARNRPRPSPEALDRLHVASSAGSLIPLRHLARVRFETSVAGIQRVDRERAVTVSSFVRSGYNTDRVTRRILSSTDSLSLPAGYRIVPSGEIESRQESFGGIGGAVLVAVFMILAILVLEFRSFRGMVIVASVIPLGALGGMLALWLSGHTLSFTSMIGFVALTGIEIKTSILLVDLTNRLREQGLGLEEALRRAGEVRFLPIVLTTLTAIGGLAPLALQGEALYAPIAWVIIGGLISSTILARIVTPVLYSLLAPAVERGAAA